MKYNVRDLKGYTITTVDGSEGKIKDILFDEDSWTVRYFETDFGNIFNSNRILIPVEILTNVGSQSKGFRLNMNRGDLDRYPKPENNNFYSRKFEEQLSSFYGTSSYWNSVPITGTETSHYNAPRSERSGSSSGSSSSSDYSSRSGSSSVSSGSSDYSSRSSTRSGVSSSGSDVGSSGITSDSSIHSFNDVTDYSIQAIDGKLGHIDDLIIDSDSWHISHVVVDTANWLPWGKKVILSINQIQDISYSNKEARINLNVDTIKNAPEYDSSTGFSDQYEHSLQDYYDRSYSK